MTEQSLRSDCDMVLPSELLSWDCEKNVLDSFDEYMQMPVELGPYSVANPAFDMASSTPTFTHVPVPQLSGTAKLDALESIQNLTAAERKLHTNRVSQKRVRERRKARMQSTEAQLAETAAELQNLKSRQGQLEARNALLEKVANIQKQSSSQESPSTVSLPWQDTALITHSSDNGPAITISINGYDQIFTVDDVGQMPPPLYADLYARYASKLGSCLLEISPNDDDLTSKQLTKWLCELTSLMIAMAQGNPKVALKHGLADFYGKQEDVNPNRRNQSFFVDLLASVDLTESQQQDMMYLRRLLFRRVGQLYRERKVLLSKMPTEKDGLCHTSKKLAEMTDTAEQLRNSGVEELKTYMQFSSAFYRGIQTCQQHAAAIVHSYPHIPEKGRFIEALASQRGEPPKEVLMQSAGMDSFQHAANWQQVVEYLQDVNAGNLNQHVPLMIQDNVPNVANSQLQGF